MNDEKACSHTDHLSLHQFMLEGCPYFIQTKTWSDESWRVTVTDGKQCWTCDVNQSDLTTSARETNMTTIDYMSMMKSALTGLSSTQEFEYAVVKHENDVLELQWKRVIEDVKYCLGKLILKKDTDEKSIITYLSECTKAVKQAYDASEKSKNEFSTILQQQRKTVESLTMCASQKQELESELLAKFVLVMNEKKRKIRQLKEQNSRYRKEIERLRSSAAAENEHSEIKSDSREPRKKLEQVKLRRASSSDNESQDACPVFAKRRKQTTAKRTSNQLSPIRSSDQNPTTYEPALSDAPTTTSSDATLEINDLIDEM